MNEVANQLAQSLFKKDTLQECSRWELEILADKYPYFGIAQFLLAGKLRNENEDAYKKQVQKTSLYFTNPLWLDYTLNTETAKTENGNGLHVVEDKETLPEEHLRFIPKIEEISPAEEIITTETEQATAAQPETIEVPIDQTPGFTFPEEIKTEGINVLAEEPIAFRETNEQPFEETKIEEINLPVEEPIASPATHDLPSPEITEAATNDFKEALEEDSSAPEQETVELKIAPLKIEPMPDLNAPLVFEALHTVDYFASQGIKLKLDELPKGKFDQQLKSFTEWLKTLKKAPAAEITKQVDKGSEQKVITLAEHSIENPDVVTETMADVWIKQGNKEKAIEVYNKLSLQNPAKSAYFAALIEQLKQS